MSTPTPTPKPEPAPERIAAAFVRALAKAKPEEIQDLDEMIRRGEI